MLEITLLLKAAQQGANGCFFEIAVPGDDQVDCLHGTRPAVPNGLHYFVFEVSEGRPNASTGCPTLCHGTICTTKEKSQSRTFLIGPSTLTYVVDENRRD